MPVVEKTVVVKMTMERKEKRAVLNQSRSCGHNNTSIVLVSVVKVCLFVYLLLHICTPSLFIKTLNTIFFVVFEFFLFWRSPLDPPSRQNI